jgi:hypothetical protein
METHGGSTARKTARRGQEGFSLLHVLVAAAILALAALALSAVQVRSIVLTATNRETAEGRQVGRRILEEIGRVPLRDVFASFNGDPLDDPGGAGTAPGSVVRLADQPGDVRAEIRFPGGSELREDVVDPDLGMPRDLDGDGSVDSADHASDYMILPVRIRVVWQGIDGERSFDLHTVLYGE